MKMPGKCEICSFSEGPTQFAAGTRRCCSSDTDRIRSQEQPDTASFSIAAVMQSAARKTATWHREDQLPGKTAFELHFCETYAF